MRSFRVPRVKLLIFGFAVAFIVAVSIVYSQKIQRRKLETARLVELVRYNREQEKWAKQKENPVVAGFKRKHNSVPGFLHLQNSQDISLNKSMSPAVLETQFYRYLEEKQILCDNDVRLGAQHDGGWNVCMTPPFRLDKTCLVYSFGIGDDWRFEDDLYHFYSCTLMMFDPSIKKKAHNRTEKMFFYPYGLAARSFTTKQGWRMKTLREHLKEHGHLQKNIDYLKFDIEMMEWGVIPNILPYLHRVKQIGFEMHLTDPKHRVDYVRKRDYLKYYRLLKKLEDLGFKKFNYRNNPFGAYKSNVTGEDRSLFYELHYLNFNFVELKHLKDK